MGVERERETGSVSWDNLYTAASLQGGRVRECHSNRRRLSRQTTKSQTPARWTTTGNVTLETKERKMTNVRA